MNTHGLKWLAAAILLIPAGLQACDCGCSDLPPGPVHFKDGLTPNGPVTGDPGSANAEYYSGSFAFRDYGPAHVTVPPVVVPPKHPNS